MRTVPRRLALCVSRVQHLENVELATSRRPARAVAVLLRAWDLSVEHPCRGHVRVESRLAGQGHLELGEEQLRRTPKAVIGHGSGAEVVAAGFVFGGALLVRHDDEFLIVADECVGEGDGPRGAGGGVSISVGERVAPCVVEYPATCSAEVVEED